MQRNSCLVTNWDEFSRHSEVKVSCSIFFDSKANILDRNLFNVSLSTLTCWQVIRSSEHLDTIFACCKSSYPPPEVPMKNSTPESLYSSGVIPSSTLSNLIFKFSSSIFGLMERKYFPYISLT